MRPHIIKQGKIVDHSVEEDDEDIKSDEEKEEGSGSESELAEDEVIEKERFHITTVISVAVSVNVVKGEWIVVAYDRDWCPGQFGKFDQEQEEMQIHFVHRPSSNHYWLVWPELSNDVPDISWVSEGE